MVHVQTIQIVSQFYIFLQISLSMGSITKHYIIGMIMWVHPIRQNNDDKIKCLLIKICISQIELFGEPRIYQKKIITYFLFI